MLEDGDIYIAKNGNTFARLTKAAAVKKGIALKLFGILLNDADFGKIRRRISGKDLRGDQYANFS